MAMLNNQMVPIFFRPTPCLRGMYVGDRTSATAVWREAARTVLSAPWTRGRCYEKMERIGKGDLLKIYENLGLSLAYPIHQYSSQCHNMFHPDLLNGPERCTQ
jgi:hypothetical protein